MGKLHARAAVDFAKDLRGPMGKFIVGTVTIKFLGNIPKDSMRG